MTQSIKEWFDNFKIESKKEGLNFYNYKVLNVKEITWKNFPSDKEERLNFIKKIGYTIGKGKKIQELIMENGETFYVEYYSIKAKGIQPYSIIDFKIKKEGFNIIERNSLRGGKEIISQQDQSKS